MKPCIIEQTFLIYISFAVLLIDAGEQVGVLIQGDHHLSESPPEPGDLKAIPPIHLHKR